MIRRTCATCAAIVLAAIMLGAGYAGAKTWDERYFPNYTVYDQDGKAYNFYDDLVRDKIVVANFIYTSCTDICGLATARLAEVVDVIGERMGKEIFVYSITLTPEIDTPEKLKNFAAAFGEAEGWKFLTGDPDEMKDLRWKLGERSRYLGEHRSDMLIGNDSKGYWRRISLMGNLARVTDEILRLDPSYSKVRTAAARAGDQNRYVISDRPGEAIFMKACSNCHSIGGGDRIGPDLEGVTERRDRDWLMQVLIDAQKLRNEGDPLFTEIDARYPSVLMPYLNLSDTDASDVLTYIKRRSIAVRFERFEAAEQAARDGHAHDHQEHEGHAHDHQELEGHTHLHEGRQPMHEEEGRPNG